MNKNKGGRKSPDRWLIAIMGTLLQLCLGTVYAWSYFQKPLTAAYGWTNSQVTWTFSIAICSLGLAAAWGGIAMPRFGPRRLAMTGGFLFGAGYLIGAAALHIRSLPLLYTGYGLIGGAGLGLGYVTPVATAAQWFPDKKGFVTGMVVMGFGLGALLMSKIFAPLMLEMTGGSMVAVFAWLGVIFMVFSMTVASFLEVPPSALHPAHQAGEAGEPAAGEAAPGGRYIFNTRFLVMWVIFFCNITAGIAIIGFQSPLLQDLLKARDPALDTASLASLGGTLIAVSSLFNGLGRFFWGGLSDRIGRITVFRIMLFTGIIAFAGLMTTQDPIIFSVLVCYILLCYGGGFGTMPSFVTTVFGQKMMAVVYGAMLTAWSAAGIAGPQIIAVIKDTYPLKASFYSFALAMLFLCTGLLFSLVITDRPWTESAGEKQEPVSS